MLQGAITLIIFSVLAEYHNVFFPYNLWRCRKLCQITLKWSKYKEQYFNKGNKIKRIQLFLLLITFIVTLFLSKFSWCIVKMTCGKITTLLKICNSTTPIEEYMYNNYIILENNTNSINLETNYGTSNVQELTGN